MAHQTANPLVAALPPETDYLTYLTIVEYNLDKGQLNTLHELLQDTKLTTNIGWDLVHLLLPLLPESEQCLQDISFLGNPRETILKVAELLEGLGQPEGSVTEEPHRYEESEDDEDEKITQPVQEEPVDMLSLQFQSLLHMLCILHPRIKTHSPSRFLTASLKAVISAFRNIQQSNDSHDMSERLQSSMRAVLMLIKSFSGSKRPHLPPRRSQSAIPIVTSREPASDPEGIEESVGPGEIRLQKQILQSFVTHVLEVYVQSLEPTGISDSALAWSTRYHELKNPVPGKPKFAQTYEVEEELEKADATISQLLSSAESDLELSWDELLHSVLNEANTDDNHSSIFNIPEFPASKPGSLYALAAKAATSLSNKRSVPYELSVFPEHSQLTELFVDDLASDIDGDALVMLGRAALESQGLGDWETRAEFNQYLQRLSQLAAGSGLASIATQASELTSTILHSHPSSDARFDFILDTLENCPYPELKEAAILWLKDEISIASKVPGVSQISIGDKEDRATGSPTFGETSNVFTHPETIKSAAPCIFAEPKSKEREDMPPSIQAKIWISALNLYYLMIASEILYETLEIHSLVAEFNINEKFIGPLEAMVKDANGSSHQDAEEGYQAFIPLIEDALLRIKDVEQRRAGKDSTTG